MDYVVIYILILVVSLIPMLAITYYIPLKKDNLGSQSAFKYIVKKYDLSMDKKRVRLLSKLIAVVNTFIISIPIAMVLFGNMRRMWVFILSFVIFVVGIVSLYNLLGFILKKKGW